jgi:hypothetical protein
VVTVEEVQVGDRLLHRESGGLLVMKREEGDKGIEFGFMETEVTPERFQEAQILKIAQVMLRLRQKGKRVA